MDELEDKAVANGINRTNGVPVMNGSNHVNGMNGVNAVNGVTGANGTNGITTSYKTNNDFSKASHIANGDGVHDMHLPRENSNSMPNLTNGRINTSSNAS